MAAFTKICLEQKGDILVITLNEPKKKNALNFKAYGELSNALEAADDDNSIQAVILTGAGDYFTSGADLSESDKFHYKDAMRDPVTAPVGKFMLSVMNFRKLLVAAVNGPAVGIGVTLLTHCDLNFASTSATFWTPFCRVAVVPEFCSSLLFPRIFGPSVANEMLIGGKLMAVEEAKSFGLISEIFPPESLMSEVHQRLRLILGQPLSGVSIPLFKRMIREPIAQALDKAFRAEMVELGRRTLNGETQEAIRMIMSSKKSHSKL